MMVFPCCVNIGQHESGYLSTFDGNLRMCYSLWATNCKQACILSQHAMLVQQSAVSNHHVPAAARGMLPVKELSEDTGVKIEQTCRGTGR
jgi:hypothetical protein